MHHIAQYAGLACILIVTHLACLWAGKRWGNKLTDEAKAELNYLRARLANKISGNPIPTGAVKSNPYKAG